MNASVQSKKWKGFIAGALLIVCAFVTGADGWTPQAFDGQWQVYDSKWSYIWYSSGDYAVWRNDAIGWGRFAYGYGNGQWFDGSWNKIGLIGASSSFLGDGAWHELNNGWSYNYTTSGDYAVWRNDAIGWGRFVTAYGSKQWYDSSWNKIGLIGASTAFIGDGAWHDLNNGWSYMYVYANDYGVWKNTAINRPRFIIGYSQGQWFDGTWNRIGGANSSTAFVGDGAWHDINNGWSYLYNTSDDFGAWQHSGQLRFGYRYLSGQWWNIGTYGNWNTLGATGISSAFLGDGAWHPISADWKFSYDSTADVGTWYQLVEAAPAQFRYAYASGQWSCALHSAFLLLGNPSLSSAFMGDGAQHGLNNGWLFAYQSDIAKFYRNVDGTPLRFSLSRLTGFWSHYDGANSAIMSWFYVDDTGLSWLWDGLKHVDRHGMIFAYDYANDELVFHAMVAGTPSETTPFAFLKYSYADHRWYDRLANDTADWCAIPAYAQQKGADGVTVTMSEVEKAWWANRTYLIGDTKLLYIYGAYTAPYEWIRDSAPHRYEWIYYYGDGTWTEWDCATSPPTVTPAGGPGADPNLYR